MALFRDREDAGRLLAKELSEHAGRPDVIVLGLPRGGVPVAFVVAKALEAPLDVFVVRKLGVPGHKELAMGAIASGGVQVLNEDVIRLERLSPSEIADVVARERGELERLERAFRGGRPPPDPLGRTVILVDDGVATGATMRAAVAALRTRGPARIVVAIPVGSRAACTQLEGEADEVVCLATPHPLTAVGIWYENFRQTTDDEVFALIERAERAA